MKLVHHTGTKKMICYFCEKEKIDANLGVVSLQTEGHWSYASERQIVLNFHQKCFEEESGIYLTKSVIQGINCPFCTSVVKLKTYDVIISTSGNYIWIHRKCWDIHGIAID